MKVKEDHIVLGGLFAFAIWIFVALPFFYTVPRYRNAADQTSNECSIEESKHHGFWEKAGCDPVAYFTLWLVAFTGVLGFSTIGLWWVTWRGGVRQSKDMQASIGVAEVAAKAAKTSADAAVAIERARFFPVIEHNFRKCIAVAEHWYGPPDQENRPLGHDDWPMAGIRFKNYGKTPGIISEVHTGIFLSEKPIDPVYDGKVVKDNIIASGDFTEVFGTLLHPPITMAEAIKIERGAIYLWIFGRIIYDDVFGNTQTHNFLQRFVCVSQFRYVLQSYDYKHYNKST